MKYQNDCSTSNTSTTSTLQQLPGSTPAPLKAGIVVGSDGDIASILSTLGNTMGNLPKAGQGELAAFCAQLLSQVSQQDPLGNQFGDSALSGSDDQQPQTFSPGDVSSGQHATGAPVHSDRKVSTVFELTAKHDLPMELPLPPSRAPSTLVNDEPTVPEGYNEAELQNMMDQFIAIDQAQPSTFFSPAIETHASPYSDDCYLTTPPSPFDAQSLIASPDMALFDDVPQDYSHMLQQLGQMIPVTEGHNVASTSSMPPMSVSSPRKSAFMGTRQPLPLDAPVQKRVYITPSVTSRKELPTSLKRKRDVGEDYEEALASVERKRQQNTMAARRSRQRKAEQLQQLEADVVSLTDERDAARREAESWKAQALLMAAAFQSAGVPIPSLPSA